MYRLDVRKAAYACFLGSRTCRTYVHDTMTLEDPRGMLAGAPQAAYAAVSSCTHVPCAVHDGVAMTDESCRFMLTQQ